MQYINADKLIAELRQQKHELELSIQSQGDYGQSCQIVAYENILSLIDTLRQEHPDVDLEKEYKKWWDSIKSKINIEHVMEWYMHETARYFYKLGLNARKED